MSNVFIAFQHNEESRPVIDAIVADNPGAQVVHSPGLVKIDAPNSLTIRRSTIEEQTGRPYDLQQIHINLVTLSGHIDEDDDQLTLSWRH
ncbi:MAG TPA: monooxygenase [Hydrogenophaga sp.]|jgi:phenol hydroxylase P2 protein|uniref:MmoB/DmpM family protein n=1 Tax=Hydrogenophaga sp. TaxID=1904254 RepID=UPI0008C8162D|nr:MmoB/DmpM family protein [Hydrogenophaga sp.]MBU4517857.1 MmoB/DmpM family protein [Gammaproteobacteria bacterium]MBW8470809.1 MmoB/DmpM family protein [Thiobacillus sp.]OGA78245.1 MAG: monooxygenase [Burkholderiales bacterium GWE1_65_30]OGA93141.1 MAG: monooxygenase [Burkholderiales bacterium GWF1_66_17]OGB33998.1 MAG: monooxygenase [Burkholderiales bacterium RIFCSPLOWO2_02_FULL_66_35]